MAEPTYQKQRGTRRWEDLEEVLIQVIVPRGPRALRGKDRVVEAVPTREPAPAWARPVEWDYQVEVAASNTHVRAFPALHTTGAGRLISPCVPWTSRIRFNNDASP